MRMGYEDTLRGRAVIDAQGTVIGEIDDLVVDTDAWKLDALRVKLRRDVADAIGVHRSAFRAASIEVPASAVQSIGETVVLRSDAAALAPSHP